MKTIFNEYEEDNYCFNVNDTYDIKGDLIEIRKLMLELEADVTNFLSDKKVKKSGTKARAKITKLKNKLLPDVARKILKTRQDYEEDYS